MLSLVVRRLGSGSKCSGVSLFLCLTCSLSVDKVCIDFKLKYVFMSGILNTHLIVYCSHTSDFSGGIMATGNVNTKSQLKNIRIPHDVIEGIEALKNDGESMAAFLVSAARNEISRRQLRESGEEKLLSSLSGALEVLEHIGEIGTRAGAQLRELVDIAQHEAQQLKIKSEPKG